MERVRLAAKLRIKEQPSFGGVGILLVYFAYPRERDGLGWNGRYGEIMKDLWFMLMGHWCVVLK